jgi:Fe-S oxidoreductase
MEELRETGADLVATSCPLCADALSGDGAAGGPAVRDLVELIADALDGEE